MLNNDWIVYSWDWEHGQNASYFHDLGFAIVWKISTLLQRCFISYTLNYAIFQIRGNRITFKCVLTLGLSGIGTSLEQMVLSGFLNIFLTSLLKSFLMSLPLVVYRAALIWTHSSSLLVFAKGCSDGGYSLSYSFLNSGFRHMFC